MTSNISIWGAAPPHWVHLGRGRGGAAGRRETHFTIYNLCDASVLLHCASVLLHCVSVLQWIELRPALVILKCKAWIEYSSEYLNLWKPQNILKKLMMRQNCNWCNCPGALFQYRYRVLIASLINTQIAVQDISPNIHCGPNTKWIIGIDTMAWL